MSDDKIAEIRDLYKYLDEYPNTDVSSGDLHHYLSFLLAEDARHRAENERLRAALRECACACSSIRECESNWAKDNYCLHLNARNALEGKP